MHINAIAQIECWYVFGQTKENENLLHFFKKKVCKLKLPEKINKTSNYQMIYSYIKWIMTDWTWIDLLLIQIWFDILLMFQSLSMKMIRKIRFNLSITKNYNLLLLSIVVVIVIINKMCEDD